MTAAGRRSRTEAADRLCATAYADLDGPATGVALVAIGGYGRGELAPYSDLDVVLMHDEDVDPGALAEKVWYPLWDSGMRLDHAVRSVREMVDAASADLRVALGLQDIRHLAGDRDLVLRVRTTMLAQWRREARDRLPELQDLVRQRHRLVGELAHVAVPDLKEAQGGLRDATVLNGLVATWLVDVPHVELERCRQALLDVRDELHGVTGRAQDRVTPEVWDELAAALDLPDALTAQVHVRELARRVAHVSRLTWRRVDAALARPSRRGGRGPQLERIAPGLALSAGEVVLDGRVSPCTEPLLLLSGAAEAAERDVVLSPATAARLAKESPPLPDPWPREARQLLVRLLASGTGLLPVWDTLEQTGALTRILPEWERIRSLPHASVVHRFTVDRHVIETCVEASALIRRVARPDVLLVAALLHDIGKGGRGDHSAEGEPIAHTVAIRMGFTEPDAALVATLVRRHLLLAETATTRDLDDPATAERLAAFLPGAGALRLLEALTEADSRATSAKAWTPWRAQLVRRLVARTESVLSAEPTPVLLEPELAIPPEVRADPKAVSVSVEPSGRGTRVTVVSGDRVGSLADAAAMLAVSRVPIRAARAWSQEEYSVSVWEVADTGLDPVVLRQRLEAIVDGRIDPGVRTRPSEPSTLGASVVVRPDASRQSTVLEVRTADRPGVIHLVCAALTRLDIMVRSAHVDTLGPQAMDVFYLQETAAGALGDDRAATAAHTVRAALADPPTRATEP